MECLFEILFQLLGEFIVGAASELLVEGIGRLIGWVVRGITGAPIPPPRSKPAPSSNSAGAVEHGSPPANSLRLAQALIWQLAGVAAGLVSLLILPRHIVDTPALHAINLLLTPLAMAGVMVAWGRFLARHDRRQTMLNHFVCAYGFALCYLLARFFFAR